MRKNGEQGFTLIELLLSLALASLVITGLMTVFWTSSRAYEGGSASADIQYMARRAVNDIGQDIKEGYNITINPAAANLLINKANDSDVEYYVNKGNLYRKHNCSSVPIAECIEQIKFNQANNGLVEVMVEAQSNDIKYVLSTAVVPRTAAP